MVGVGSTGVCRSCRTGPNRAYATAGTAMTTAPTTPATTARTRRRCATVARTAVAPAGRTDGPAWTVNRSNASTIRSSRIVVHPLLELRGQFGASPAEPGLDGPL